jgi:hypothetical protein
LIGKAVDVVKAGAADNADAMSCHGDFVAANGAKGTKKMLNCPD